MITGCVGLLCSRKLAGWVDIGLRGEWNEIKRLFPWPIRMGEYAWHSDRRGGTSEAVSDNCWRCQRNIQAATARWSSPHRIDRCADLDDPRRLVD